MEDKIIIIDDDPDYLDILWSRLRSAGFNHVQIEYSSRKAAERFRQGEDFDLAMIDLNMPDMDGMQLLEVIRSSSPGTECIMVTAVDDIHTAINCMRKGAYDYLIKPVPQQNLILSVNRALERKRLLDILDIDKRKALPELTHKDPFRPILTRSRNVLKVLKEAELHARSDVPILITGETGTGKDLLARAIHAASPRADAPFTPVNMASLGESLFDAEFFGHTRGAFTGAEKARAGYLEHTHGGSLFLDEIGVMPLGLQGKLLRVLQSGEYLKLGTSEPRQTDVRIIAATNEELEQMIARKTFRKDLYYRLRGGWLHLPPLRERKADIPLLINHFLENRCTSQTKCRVDLQSLSLLMNYAYPGNIRELKSIIQSSINLARDGVITAACLPDSLRATIPRPECPPPPGETSAGRSAAGTEDVTGEILPLAEVEKAHILKVYRQTDRNKSRTARLLGIGLNTLRRRLEAYDVK